MMSATETAVRSALNMLLAQIAASAPLPAFPNRILISDIVARVAWETGLTAADITGRSRKAHINRARFAVVWLARTLGNSAQKIGHALARDHSTILDAQCRANFFREKDSAYRHMTDGILQYFCDLQEN